MSSDRYPSLSLSTIPRLTSENYHDWKFAVSLFLRARGCWSIIEGKEERPEDDTKAGGEWDRKSEDGLTIIGLTVDPAQYTYIRDSTTGPAAWKALKDVYEKNSRATRISLKRQFYGFEHDMDAPMATYVNGITDLAAKLKAIGVKLTDEDITDVLIFNLHADYSSIAASLTAAKGDLTLSDVTGALLEEERRRGGPIGDSPFSLQASQDGYGGPASGSRRGPNRDRRDGITDHRKCYRCGRAGHLAQHCRAIRTVDGKDLIGPEEKEQSTYAYQLNATLNDCCY